MHFMQPIILTFGTPVHLDQVSPGTPVHLYQVSPVHLYTWCPYHLCKLFFGGLEIGPIRKAETV